MQMESPALVVHEPEEVVGALPLGRGGQSGEVLPHLRMENGDKHGALRFTALRRFVSLFMVQSCSLLMNVIMF